MLQILRGIAWRLARPQFALMTLRLFWHPLLKIVEAAEHDNRICWRRACGRASGSAQVAQY
ncbi:MAG: hypothetical protein U5L02_07945 [Rheinheimera sp.]|nr:hypothetical protein [Rheinheimera sp.]